ncbi:MAG: CheB methylesterase domain-containing protein, partial [Chloroflexota bacterium]|nr:CheB methylesterase domain-containing protein [Chloroflexota bacterium]
VKSLATVTVIRRWAERPSSADPAAPLAPRRVGGVGIVAIATSTGGPAALHRILSELPKGFAVPILVVQHIALGFGQGFADWLDAASPLRVKIAANGERLEPGVVYISPDDFHLGVSDTQTVLTSSRPPVAGFRPSGTFLFQTVSDVFGAKAAGVILTGMGTDGLDGLRVLKSRGGLVVAQDEASSVVYGMNAAAIEARVADEVVSLEDMAPRLQSLVGGS